MAGKDTKLAVSKTIKQGRKRTHVRQQSSSGAPEPAPDPFFNPLGDYDLSILRKRIDTSAKAQELRDPIRRFAGESQSRIEQDLLMLQRGIGSKEILRRWAIYKKLVKLRKARKAKRFSPAQEAELQALQQVARERRLAQNLRKARKEKLLSPEQESELQVLQQAEMDSRAAARISEAQRPLDPMERFAGESESRITPHRMAKQKEYERKYDATPQGKARDVPGHPAGQSRPEDEAGRRASDWCNASTQTW